MGLMENKLEPVEILPGIKSLLLITKNIRD